MSFKNHFVNRIIFQQNITFLVNATSLRKVKTTVESLHSEKLKMEKEKGKKNKGKGKAKLKVEGESFYEDIGSYDNDYDDFMQRPSLRIFQASENLSIFTNITRILLQFNVNKYE